MTSGDNPPIDLFVHITALEEHYKTTVRLDIHITYFGSSWLDRHYQRIAVHYFLLQQQ
jgi:hypothetical protein